MPGIEAIVGIITSSEWSKILQILFDVGIVYYIVYRVLLLIKGTKAVQMLVGLFVIILFFFASKEDYLDLPSLNFVLDKFIASFILIVIVVFQDDLRRGLSEFGKTSAFFSSRRTSRDSHVIEEVVKASTMLASKKLGALIVIERDANLSALVTEGFELNAKVSKELLFSAFLPSHENPLHDGAVLIRDDEIVSAGCFLPLTNRASVAKTLGTRHRAAIGMSEVADAPIVVVSEETGIISVAYREELTRHLDATSLRDLLHRILTADDEEEAKKSGPSWLARFTPSGSSARNRAKRRDDKPSADQEAA